MISIHFALLILAIMWLLFIWSQIVNVMKSDRYASLCTDISTLFKCAKVWSLKGWVCLNAGHLCCLKMWNVKFLIPFSTTILQYS